MFTSILDSEAKMAWHCLHSRIYSMRNSLQLGQTIFQYIYDGDW